jgi:hypothetical protein
MTPPTNPKGETMEPVNRRSFLIKGSAGAVGAVAVVGGGVALTSSGAESALSDEELAAIDGPVVMQIRDARAGEVEVLVDEREVVFTDRALVARVLRAAS